MNDKASHFWFIERERTSIIVRKLEINLEYLNINDIHHDILLKFSILFFFDVI